MSKSKRDNAGRFRSKDGAQPSATRFDLTVEAQRLYQLAQAREDFTGAASVLRLMRDLRPESTGKTAIDDPLYVDVSKLSNDEFAELCVLLDALDAFAARINGISTTPVVDVPIVAPPTPPAAPVIEEAPFELGDNEVEIELEKGELLPGEEPCTGTAGAPGVTMVNAIGTVVNPVAGERP